MDLYHIAKTLHALIAGIMLGIAIIFPWILYKIRKTVSTEKTVLKYCMNTCIAICGLYLIIFFASAMVDAFILNTK